MGGVALRVLSRGARLQGCCRGCKFAYGACWGCRLGDGWFCSRL